MTFSFLERFQDPPFGCLLNVLDIRDSTVYLHKLQESY